MYKYIKLVGLVLGLVVVAGCETDGRVTGGGTMHSAGGDGKTVFTFNGQRCPDKDGVSETKGKVVLHDKTAIDFEAVGGVDLHGSLRNAAFCGDGTPVDGAVTVCRCGDQQFQLEFDYRSTNNKAAGEGTGIACLVDFGKGNGLHGAAVIQLESGPYNGYVNVGGMDGQVNVKACPSESEDE